MAYSRNNPSPRYREMTELYRRLHREGEQQRGLPPEKMFPGLSLLPHIGNIKNLIKKTGATTLLDYGCGKGLLYEPRPLPVPGEGVFEGVIDYWDIDEVRCYDPSYDRYSALPEGQFDGVISTDVLEHCMEDDIPWIVEEMFSYATRFVYAAIACYPAMATLPTGENAHTTVRPPEWWDAIFAAANAKHPGVLRQISIEVHDDGHQD